MQTYTIDTPSGYAEIPAESEDAARRLASSPSPRKPNGYILHEDSSRVVIATGFRRKSANRKTGSMVQIWVLVRSEDPLQAVASGRDRLICGSCPLRGSKGKKRACYVNVGQAPKAVWKAYKSGSYPPLTDINVFLRRTVRFGAYGDPTHLPIAIARQIAVVSNGWTGYTHQWRKPSFQPWKFLVQASVDSRAEKELAESMGWGTFLVIPKGSPHPTNAIECLSDKSGVQCHDCLLCSGKGRSIFIEAHGSGAKYVASRN